MFCIRNGIVAVSIGYGASVMRGRRRYRCSWSSETVPRSGVYGYAGFGRIDSYVVFVSLHEHAARPKVHTRLRIRHDPRGDNLRAPARTF